MTYNARPQALQGLGAVMAQQVKGPAAKPHDLSPLPGMHMLDCLPKVQ